MKVKIIVLGLLLLAGVFVWQKMYTHPLKETAAVPENAPAAAAGETPAAVDSPAPAGSDAAMQNNKKAGSSQEETPRRSEILVQ